MSAPDLATLQRRLQDAILGREEPVPFLSGAGTAGRLDVYRSAYRLRLTEALAVDYPMLARWLGEARFADLARAYLTAYPSRTRSIRWVGRHLAGFLHTALPWRKQPEYAEMAAFEWALGLAFDCADADPLAPEALARIPPQRWPGLRFGLHPGVRLLTLDYPVPQIWKALQAGAAMPPCERREAVTWLVWRRGWKVFFRSVTEPEGHALQALCAGRSFAEVCAGLARWDFPTDVAREAAGLLRRWLEEGIIVEVQEAPGADGTGPGVPR